MKTLFKLSLFFLLPQIVFSQTSFELFINSDYDDRPIDIIEDNEGNYFIAARKLDYSTLFYHTYLVKINGYGEILAEKDINRNDKCGILNLFQTADNNFIGLGHFQADSSINYNFWILKFDSDLNILWEKQYYTNYESVTRIYSLTDKNGNIIITGSSKQGNDGDFFISKISPNGDVLLSRVFPVAGWQFVFDIIEKKDNSGYYVLASGFYNEVPHDLGNIIEIDTSFFNIKSIKAIPRHIHYDNTAKWITDTIYIITGRVRPVENTADVNLGVIIIDTARNVLHENYFGKQDTADYVAFNDNLDFIDTSNIYFGGFCNLDIYAYPFQEESSWIILNKMNSNLELKFQRFYGGDAFYELWNVLATKDGGCLLTGRKYDYTTQNNEGEIFIFKVNKDGLITSSDENIIESKEIIIYPNPGHDKLCIRSALNKNNIVFELFDIRGTIVFRKNINDSIFEINTNSISSGIYFYRIYEGQNIIDSGKWIKQ